MVAVLFDLEGTLVQTPYFENMDNVREFRRQTRMKMVSLAIPPRVLEGIEAYTLMRNKAIEYAEENFNKKQAEIFHKELGRFVEIYEMHSAESTRVFSETISTLRELKERSYKMGIVTNTSRKAADLILDKCGLKECFRIIITRENVKKFKPDPEGVILALKKLGEKDFFVVGDSVYDALAAKEAGGISIIINRNPSKVLDFHADYVVRSLAEIPALICAKVKRCNNRRKL